MRARKGIGVAVLAVAGILMVSGYGYAQGVGNVGALPSVFPGNPAVGGWVIGQYGVVRDPNGPGVDQEPDQPQRRQHHRSARADLHVAGVAGHRGYSAVERLARADPHAGLGLGTACRLLGQWSSCCRA